MFQVINPTPNHLADQIRNILAETALEAECERVSNVYQSVRTAEEALNAYVPAVARRTLVMRANMARRKFDALRLRLPSHLRNGRN